MKFSKVVFLLTGTWYSSSVSSINLHCS